jgi:hypothetical protein
MIEAEISEKTVPAQWIICDKCSLSNKTSEIMAVPISSSSSAATVRYGCKNSILLLVEVFHVLDNLLFSDEAWLCLSGYINSQNSRLWTAENPCTVRETPLHSL